MPVEQVKIPQNVYIEDRIIGPITLRQLMIMTGGGGLTYVLFTLVQRSVPQMNIFLTILCSLPLVIASAFALIKINDLSLLRIVFLILERTYKSPVRTYAARQGISVNVRFLSFVRSAEEDEKERQKEEKSRLEQAKSQTKIRELSRLIDRPLTDLEAQPAPPQISEPSALVVTDDEAKTQEQTVKAVSDEDAPLPLPVNPSRIAVDGKRPGLQQPALSDLSVFRDIFTPHTPLA